MKQTEPEFENEKQKVIHSILTQSTQYQSKKFTKQMLNVDLVIKLNVPSPQESYIKKSEDIPLTQFLYNPSSDLQKAYDIAYADLLKQIKIQEVGQQKYVLIPNRPHIELVLGYPQYNRYEVVDQQLQLEIHSKKQIKSPKLTAFTLKYNALMYVLQEKCGFNVFSYLTEVETNIEDKKKQVIYILITQTNQNLMRSADRHKIKKQVDYSQLDLFLNQPCDYQNRPYKYNSKIQNLQNCAKIKSSLTAFNHQIRIKPIANQEKDHQKKEQLSEFLQKRLKRINRKMLQKSYDLKKTIIQEVNIWQSEVQKFNKYFSSNLQGFQKIISTKQILTHQEKAYIYSLNRKKVNDGCYKEYLLKKKRKKYFEELILLNKQNGYKVHKTPMSYFQFTLPSKKLPFFQKLRSLLFYQEYKISPYGDLSLFLKMERIKIGYLTLKQFVRAQNLKNIQCQIFALHDSFELRGEYDNIIDEERQKYPQIKGGINGKNVIDNWNVLTPWRSNIQLLRNYFGEDTTYGIYLKNHLITYFIIIAPLGIAGELISRLLIYFKQKSQGGISNTSQEQFAFHVVYFTIMITLYNVFLQFWNIKERNYFQCFVQKQVQSTFKYGYRGPYVRNAVSDSVNQYPNQLSLKYRALQLLFIFIMILILFAQAGIFFGFRMMIVQIYSSFPQTNLYLISWPHIISYGIFFAFNNLLFKIVIKKFTKYLSKKQNPPTNQQYKNSYLRKNYIFMIGIQLLGPFFLLILEPFAKTSCFSSQCAQQLTYYIYSRYFFVFLYLGYKLGHFLFKYFKSGVRNLIQNEEKHYLSEKTFYHSFQYLIEKVQIQDKKMKFYQDNTDQTLSLLHYSIFATSFPLCPVLSLGSMILQYGIQKLELLGKTRRPICKSQPIQSYLTPYILIMHLGIFINVWIMIFTLEQIQYVFQSGIEALVGTKPTQQGVLALKIFVIALFIIIFELIAKLARLFISSGNKDTIQKRKNYKLNQYIKRKIHKEKNKSKESIKIRSLKTIFRTYHKELVDKLLKKNPQIKQIEQSQQTSALQLRKSKKT